MLVCAGDRSRPVSVGCVAGDAQSYILFCDFFDRVIEAHHQHKISSQTPEGDFNYDNLKVAQNKLKQSSLDKATLYFSTL